MSTKDLIKHIGFSPKERAAGVYRKIYTNGYVVEVDIENESINYGKDIQSESKTTQNFSQDENFVVLECVNRLLEKGYKPHNIILEKTWKLGHQEKGRLDILVTKDDGTAYLMIECKTFGAEFEKERKNLYKNGGQLFSYFQQDKNTEILMLYASELKKDKFDYRNEIIKIEDDYRQTNNVEDLFAKWNKIAKDNGIFENWVKPYNFESKAIIQKHLKPIKQEDSSFIFNQFLEILRHNVVSDKPNAFNKIFNLFLCKVYDEKMTKPNEEVKFQWREGVDTSSGEDAYVDFLINLTDLYQKGMLDFLDKKVTDFSEEDFNKKYGTLSSTIKSELLKEFKKIRLEKNNEFAIKEVFDNQSFLENAKIVKEVVELLQGYHLRYNKRQQYLSDFFELLLTTGLKQEAGQFFTPVPIAQFIIKSLPVDTFVNEKLEQGEKNNLLPYIIDYAAGSGHFITESMHEIQRLLDNKNPDDYIENTAKKIKTWQTDHFDWATQYIYGIEKDYRLVKVGKVGCYLHGDGLANVILSDGLANFEKTKEYKDALKWTDKDFSQENRQFEIIISNPPYSISAFKNTAKEYYNENDFELYKYLTDSSSEIECLFVERTKQLLKDSGIAGIILPSSILSSEGIYTKAREIILKYFEIVAITEFGSNTFMATGTNTVVLFLKRRNNYDSINLKKSIDNFFTNFQDVVLNGIEKPFSKYVTHVWKNITLEDYVALIKNKPNVKIENHEFYKNYKKSVKQKIDNELFKQKKNRKTALTSADIDKIKERVENECFNALIEMEKEKLLYFIIAYPQKIVLVKTGEKDAEKRFLGYEFSNRRGSEGIHPIQRGKSIAECTRLFDEDIFDNPEKASTYIYKAFAEDYETPIHESLKNHISRVHLVDMLTFDREIFAKNISTAVKNKTTIESKCEAKQLAAILSVLESGKRPQGGVSEYQSGIPSLGGEHIKLDGTISLENMKYVPENYFIQAKQGILQDFDILICKDGALTGKIALFKQQFFPYEQGMINEHVFILRTNERCLQQYLFNVLYSEKGQELLKLNITGTAQGGLNRENLLNIKIPLPPIPIQQKIVAEIEVLEKKEDEAKGKIENLKTKIADKFNSKIANNETLKIGDVCEMKAGNFVKVGDISNDYKAGLFPCYGGNGLRGYTKTYTHEGKYSLVGRQGALCGNVHLVAGKFHATEHALVVTPKQTIDTIWLYHKLVAMNLNQYATGTVQPGLSVMNLTPILVSIPPFSEQQKIVAEIEKIEAEIAKSQKIIDEIPALKNEVLKKYV